MNVETYRHVLAKRGEEVDKRSSGHFTRADIAFRKDLMNGKIVWYNKCRKDWHAYLKNEHQIYSICRAPKGHPFTRCERFMVLICDIGLAAGLGILVALIDKWQFLDNAQTSTPSPTSDSIFSFENIEFPYLNPDIDTERFIYGQIASTIAGFIQAAIYGRLVFLAVCPCCQKNSCPGCCRDIFEMIGNGLIIVWGAGVMFELAGLVLLAASEDIFGEFVGGFILGTVKSWIWSVLWLSISFWRQWKKEKEDMKKLRKLKVTFMDYEDCFDGKELRVKLPGGGGMEQIQRTSTVYKSTLSLTLHDDDEIIAMDAAITARNYKRDKPNRNDQDEVHDIFEKSTQKFKNQKARTKAAQEAWKLIKKAPDWKREIYILRQKHLGTDGGSANTTPISRPQPPPPAQPAPPSQPASPSQPAPPSQPQPPSIELTQNRSYDRNKPNNDDFKEIQEIFDKSCQDFKDKKARSRAASQAWKLLKKNPDWKQEIENLRQMHLGTNAATPVRKSTDIEVVYGAQTPTSSIISMQTKQSFSAADESRNDRSKPNMDDFKEIQDIFDKSSQEFKNKKARSRAASQAWKLLKKNPNWKQEIIDLRREHLGTDNGNISSPPSRKSTDIDIVYGKQSRASSVASTQSMESGRDYDRDKPNQDDFKEIQEIFDKSSQEFKNKKARTRAASRAWKELKKNPNWKQEIYDLRQQHLGTNGVSIISPPSRKSTDVEVVYGADSRPSSMISIQSQSPATIQSQTSPPAQIVPAPLSPLQPPAEPQNDSLPEGWKSYTTPDGKVYYENESTNEIQWSKPQPAPPEEVLPEGWKKCATPDGKVYYQNDITQETRWSKPEPAPQRDVLPEGWKKCATPDGKVYYQNDSTQETRWTKPEPEPTIIQSIQHQMQTL